MTHGEPRHQAESVRNPCGRACCSAGVWLPRDPVGHPAPDGPEATSTAIPNDSDSPIESRPTSRKSHCAGRGVGYLPARRLSRKNGLRWVKGDRTASRLAQPMCARGPSVVPRASNRQATRGDAAPLQNPAVAVLLTMAQNPRYVRPPPSEIVRGPSIRSMPAQLAQRSTGPRRLAAPLAVPPVRGRVVLLQGASASANGDSAGSATANGTVACP